MCQILVAYLETAMPCSWKSKPIISHIPALGYIIHISTMTSCILSRVCPCWRVQSNPSSFQISRNFVRLIGRVSHDSLQETDKILTQYRRQLYQWICEFQPQSPYPLGRLSKAAWCGAQFGQGVLWGPYLPCHQVVSISSTYELVYSGSLNV